MGIVGPEAQVGESHKASRSSSSNSIGRERRWAHEHLSHFVPLLEPFRDGELSPSEVVDVETHLVECERCSERLRSAEAMRVSLKEVVRAGRSVPTRSRSEFAWL
jgi:anti-sigma factor RsiW